MLLGGLWWPLALIAVAVVVPAMVAGILPRLARTALLLTLPIAISANLFSGVTGGGTDFLVAAFRQAGADVGAATVGQGLISDPIFGILGWLVLLIFVVFIIGFLALLFVRRDLTVAYVVVGGILTGVVAALISAPISANLFGGVTGSGTDFLVAAFRQGGSDIGTATFQQGLLSDPVDKLVTFFVVYLILNAMARRTKARFPQGERLLDEEEARPQEAYA